MKKEIPKAYEPSKYEDKIYRKWERSGYFNPDNLPCGKAQDRSLSKKVKNYSIIMPPANVTGTLHMGHAVMLAIEDILIRYHRMKGERALWIPGTDHAAIATQTKVEKILKEEGTNRHELGREKFLKRVEKFAKDSHDTIVNQVKKIGSSCDWSREAYTLDKIRTKVVRAVFKMMYDDGLIYRGERIVNWCPRCHSTLADDEVEYEEEKGKFYWLKYGPFVLATARPETKLGDTAVAVHPDDKRYQKMVGKKYMIPGVLGEFEIVVVADRSVDPEFGSGAIKVTPSHSFADSEIAAQHGIPTKQIINEDGKMMANCGKYAGLTTSQARKKIVADMEKMGLIDHIDDNYTHNIAVCYRCNTQIEPLPSEQWFIDVNKPLKNQKSKIKNQKLIDWEGKTIKDVAIDVVKSGKIRIIPERFEKNYFHWLDNLRDWCISRQIWFGHQVPVWYRRMSDVGCRMSEIDITYFPHGTTTDNEDSISTGWNPGKLSELGIKQSKDLWSKIKHKKFDIAICSDLKRAVDSAELTFKDRIPIIKDRRLRECNYGDLNGEKSKKVKLLKPKYIKTPFPNGESYRDVEERIKNFLNDILKKYSNKKVVIISHHAPQLALEVIIKGKTWEQAFKDDWRKNKKWQTGWQYKLKSAVAGILARKIWDLKIYGRDIFKGFVDGTKKIETRAGRLEGSEKYWGDFKPGDIIEFSLADAKTDKIIKKIKPVKKMIKRVAHFDTIDKMFKIYKPEDDYPGKTSEDIKRWWNKYPYMVDRIKEYGIWAIELVEPIENKSKIELILVRHGQTDWNKNGIMQGQKNVLLNNKGEVDARKLAKKIKAEKFDIIFTSPLKRTSRTAELLNSYKVKIVEDDRLKERGYGKFEGKKTAEILKKHPEIITFEVNGLPYWIDVPTAETYDEVRARVKDFLDDIKKKYAGKRIMVVSHGDTLDMFYAVLNNLPNEKAYGRYSLNMRLEKYELDSGEIYVGIEPPKGKDWIQDEDTLDTWFSSGLWTFSTMADSADQINIKNGELIIDSQDFKNFHPTNVLETGYDILFFWVARMIIMTTYAVGDIPFQDVYLHGLIRDEKGKKMSKSIGNVIDPLDMIKKYGADATRLSLIIGMTPGGDVNLSEEKIAGYRNFVNKLWNISRYVISNYKLRITNDKIKINDLTLADKWILNKLRILIREITQDMGYYQFSSAGEKLREFTWGVLADWYIEVNKIENHKYKSLIIFDILKDLLKLWHPFMPFVTEAIWSNIKRDKSLIIERWPQEQRLIVWGIFGRRYIEDFEKIKSIIIAIRNARAENKVEPKKKIKAIIYAGKHKKLIESQTELIKGLRTGIRGLEISEKGPKIKDEIHISVCEVDIYLIGAIDKDKEVKRIKKEKDNLEKMIKIAEKKLANKNFIKKAPENIVDLEKKKLEERKRELKKLNK